MAYTKHTLAPGTDLSSYTTVGGLQVHPALVDVIEKKVCPDTGFSPAYFWTCLAHLITELAPELDRLLAFRDELQTRIDNFYDERKGSNLADPEHRESARSFLKEIGYLVPDEGNVSIITQSVDEEIAGVPAPQLVCPSDNSRFVLNAVNARWGSLYDALYGFDVIPQTKAQSPVLATKSGNEIGPASGYNPVRGEAVIEFANGLLDEIAPLATGRWSEVTRAWPRFVGGSQQLEVQLQSGESTGLRVPSLFVGSTGSLGPPDGHRNRTMKGIREKTPRAPDKGQIFLKHNGLHLILEIDRTHPVGQTSLSGIKDMVMESALTAILDMEDSVAAVDAEDKARIYSNISGVFRGTLSAPVVKDGNVTTRTLSNDLWYRDQRLNSKRIPGRVLVLVRTVGHHMFTDAVVTAGGQPVPEGFLDLLVTVASALHDLRGNSPLCNSRAGSIYIVKPKMHGPDEVRLTSRLFSRVEEFFGLQTNTIKIGIMDEERRTSANLRECIRAAFERVVFINTGFLDRTGDEIHTCMSAGPVVKKGDMRQQLWIKAYEAANVEVGLFSGMQGKGQIGKGMWAKPDSMKAMLEAKVNELMAGATTAWVPSPAAGTLHAIHYHRVDVLARQAQLSMRAPALPEDLLVPPLQQGRLTKEEVSHELRENAQSILGYVVRWVDQGVGCSKVPDLSNVGLMEDRATLRISSQLLSNWLAHGVISEEEVKEVFLEMARVVDQQNIRDRAYTPMASDPQGSIAFQAALKLVIDGRHAPNGYTEYTLHEARRQKKASVPSVGQNLSEITQSRL